MWQGILHDRARADNQRGRSGANYLEGAPTMLTIDAQVHAYERDHAGRPWVAKLHGPDEVTGQDMVAAMDAVGVDGALLVSPWTMYRYDAGYALEVYRDYPDRFALIKPVDPADPGVADTVADWADTDGAVAIRLMIADEFMSAGSEAGIDLVLKSAAGHGLPVNILCWGQLARAKELAARHPDTLLVIDHLGLKQPFEPPVPDAPFSDLQNLLELADHQNIAVKISGACTLSREPYPYNDIWDPLCRIFDAFGFGRCMWGTDWTRAVEFLTYSQGVEPFRLSDRISDVDRAALMGQSLAKIYKWSPVKR